MINHRLMLWWRVGFLGLVLAAGCAQRNARYCGDGACVDPVYPYCDIDGQLGGEPKTCIAVACTPSEFVACRGDQAITCNSAGNNYELIQCERGCDDAFGGCSGCAAGGPCATVQVATTGDDSHDGLTAPVKTLKRAIGIAKANPAIGKISLAVGRYGASNGETYPYMVPANVIVAGPVGGGAILAGSTTGAGLALETGELVDLDFEDFTVAITSTGTGQLSNVRVRTSAVALRGETTARLMTSNLDIMGAAGSCATGVELFGNATLMATDLVTRMLGTTLSANGGSTVNIARANVTGANSCNQTVFYVATNSTFILSDSVVDGGALGVGVAGTSPPAQATLTNTTIRHMRTDAVGGQGVAFAMIGGELSNNGNSGVSAIGGNWSFTNVAIKDNGADGIYLLGGSAGPCKLTMRGATISGNFIGIESDTCPSIDFGTAASPGNNILQGNSNVGLYIYGSGSGHVDAAGNTWRGNTQGADATGKYVPPAMVAGFISRVTANNFAIDNSTWTLLR